MTAWYVKSKKKQDMRLEIRKGKVFWGVPRKLPQMKLAPNMDKYMKMFFGNYSECYARESKGQLIEILPFQNYVFTA